MDMQRWRLHEEIKSQYEDTYNNMKLANTKDIVTDTTKKQSNINTDNTTSTSVQK